MAGTGRLTSPYKDFRTEDVLVIYGNSVFNETDTTVNVAAFTAMQVVYACVATLRHASLTIDANDLLVHDAIIDSNGLTFGRRPSGTPGMGVDFIAIGQPAVGKDTLFAAFTVTDGDQQAVVRNFYPNAQGNPFDFAALRHKVNFSISPILKKSAPLLFDFMLEKVGIDRLSACLPCGYLHPAKVNWEELEEMIFQYCIGFPALQFHIDDSDFMLHKVDSLRREDWNPVFIFGYEAESKRPVKRCIWNLHLMRVPIRDSEYEKEMVAIKRKIEQVKEDPFHPHYVHINIYNWGISSVEKLNLMLDQIAGWGVEIVSLEDLRRMAQ